MVILSQLTVGGSAARGFTDEPCNRQNDANTKTGNSQILDQRVGCNRLLGRSQNNRLPLYFLLF